MSTQDRKRRSWTPRARRSATCAVAALACGVIGAPAAHALVPAERGSVPLGSAVWYACADARFSGPAPLRCQVQPFNARYATTFVESFDRLTPENEFKMLWTQPRQDKFDFAVADKVTAFAQRHGKGVRGHALVYGAANPAWVDRPLLPWSRSRLLAVMRKHITTMVNRYKARGVREWDVVNEPFVESGGRDPSVYQRVIGNDWIEQAFRAARAADPGALLYLNEFNADVDGARQDAVLALVRDFLRRGVPIDGVGLEMHVGAGGFYPSLQQLKDVMAEYAALGLRVEVTELDVLRPVDAPGVNADVVQRTAYDTVAQACQESRNCTGVTVWGVADPYSWRGAAQMATVFTGSPSKEPSRAGQFNRKQSYDRLRCRLSTPAPAPPADCGPLQQTQANATPMVTGPVTEGSPESDPPG